MSYIRSIENLIVADDYYVVVTAIVEDMHLKYPATYIDPPEYEPAYCTASFELADDEVLPEDELELITFIESLDLDWKVLEDEL